MLQLRLANRNELFGGGSLAVECGKDGTQLRALRRRRLPAGCKAAWVAVGQRRYVVGVEQG